jgi:hypothetical protein
MSSAFSLSRKCDLLNKVRDFAKAVKCRSLKDFQSLAGHVNWSLAVFPLLKPALSAVYAKMAGKSLPMASIRVNNAVQNELLWFAKHADDSDGIFLLKSIAWDPTVDTSTADICFTDASPDGIAFWFPEFKLGFQCQIPSNADQCLIFYYKALAVTCSILHRIPHRKPRMVIYSDNQNTVDIWHSFKASAPYNQLLIIAIDEIFNLRIDTRVLHIPSVSNSVADALSRFNNDVALHFVPGLEILSFQPPRGTLGAVQK